jgi:hypothetical protein
MAVDLAAPAPPAEPEPIEATSAVDQAVVSGDVASYREARRAERMGKPLAPAAETPAAVEPAAAAAAPALEGGRPVSKRQQDVNTRIREAVERATAESTAEVTRLRAQLAAPAAPAPVEKPATPPAAAPPVAKFPEYEQYLETNPTATLRDWMDAHADWRDAQKTASEQTRTAAEQQAQAHQTRVTTFSDRVKERVTANPKFLETISPAVTGLRPFADLKEGERGGPLNVVAEEILDSPVAPALMEHLSAHPEELERLGSLKDPRAVVREIAKLEALYDQAERAPAAPRLKTVTSAPEPATTLGARPASGGDPVASAVAHNNFLGYRAERRRQRLAERAR